MSETLEDRVRAAVRAIADEPEFAPKPVVAQRKSLAWRRLAPVTAALAALAAVAALSVLLPGGGGRGPVTPPTRDGEAVLPPQIAGMSMLTANLSDAPLGQAGIVVTGHAFPLSTAGLTQRVVVGGDGRTYRRVDLAEERGASGADGDWRNAQALLSPDGRRLAIGRYGAAATEIPILDLVTGTRRDYRLDEPAAYHLLAWSADGRMLAMALDHDPGAEHFQKPGEKFPAGYPPAILDTHTGAIATVRDVMIRPFDGNVHFARDGLLGVVTVTDIGSSSPTSWLTVISFGSDEGPHPPEVVHTLRIPYGMGFAGWTQGGEPVLFRHENERVEINVVGLAEGKAVLPPVQIPRPNVSIAGWRSPTVMLALTRGAKDQEIVAIDVETGRLEVVGTVQSGFLVSGGITNAAADLLAVAVSRQTTPERGPWPTWIWLTLASAGVVVAGIVAWRVHRRLTSPQGRAADWRPWRRSTS